jgi:hypothetical protein
MDHGLLDPWLMEATMTKRAAPWIVWMATAMLAGCAPPAAEEREATAYADGKGDSVAIADSSFTTEDDFSGRVREEEDSALESAPASLDGPLIEVRQPVPYRADDDDDHDTIDVLPHKDAAGTYRVDATIRVTDQGRGIDWSSVRLKGSKGIVSYKVDVDESWKVPSQNVIAVRNYAVPNCKKNSTFFLNLCKFSAHVYVKDKAGNESHMRYYVNVKMP